MRTSGVTVLKQPPVDAQLAINESWGAKLRRFVKTSPIGAWASVALLLLILIALFAEQVAPYYPLEADFKALRHPPSMAHWLGTDNLGRDVLSRLIYGARLSLFVAGVSTVLSKIIGIAWGIVTGYVGGTFDLISQRIVDILLAFPGIILSMLLLAALGGGFGTVILAITILGVAGTVRVIRSVVLTVKEMAYVEAARATGVPSLQIMFRHVALVLFSASLGGAIFAEAALSFLGLGIPQPTPSWGNMLGGILADQFRPKWWLVLFPGMTISLTVLAFNLIGDALRDYLDPKLRGRLE